MNRHIAERLVVGIFIIIFSAATFLSSPLALAQEQIPIGGEIAGGYSQSYNIELKVGQEISGVLNMRMQGQTLSLSIGDSFSNVIYTFGSSGTGGAFQYAAEVSGPHRLIISNPDSFSVGTRGYNGYYVIRPTTLAPGTGTGTKITGDAAKSSTNTSSSTAIWWVLGIIAFFIVAIGMFVGTRRSSRRRIIITGVDDNDYDDGDNRDVYIHSRTIPCDNCGGTGRVPSLYIPRASVKCRACDGTGYLYD